jgi:hypothetical protein
MRFVFFDIESITLKGMSITLEVGEVGSKEAPLD